MPAFQSLFRARQSILEGKMEHEDRAFQWGSKGLSRTLTTTLLFPYRLSATVSRCNTSVCIPFALLLLATFFLFF